MKVTFYKYNGTSKLKATTVRTNGMGSACRVSIESGEDGQRQCRVRAPMGLMSVGGRTCVSGRTRTTLLGYEHSEGNVPGTASMTEPSGSSILRMPRASQGVNSSTIHATLITDVNRTSTSFRLSPANTSRSRQAWNVSIASSLRPKSPTPFQL